MRPDDVRAIGRLGSGEAAPPRRQSLLRSQAHCALLPAATPRMMGLRQLTARRSHERTWRELRLRGRLHVRGGRPGTERRSVVVTYGKLIFATFDPLAARAAGYAVGLPERDSLE